MHQARKDEAFQFIFNRGNIFLKFLFETPEVFHNTSRKTSHRCFTSFCCFPDCNQNSLLKFEIWCDISFSNYNYVEQCGKHFRMVFLTWKSLPFSVVVFRWGRWGLFVGFGRHFADVMEETFSASSVKCNENIKCCFLADVYVYVFTHYACIWDFCQRYQNCVLFLGQKHLLQLCAMPLISIGHFSIWFENSTAPNCMRNEIASACTILRMKAIWNSKPSTSMGERKINGKMFQYAIPCPFSNDQLFQFCWKECYCKGLGSGFSVCEWGIWIVLLLLSSFFVLNCAEINFETFYGIFTEFRRNPGFLGHRPNKTNSDFVMGRGCELKLQGKEP